MLQTREMQDQGHGVLREFFANLSRVVREGFT